MQLIGMQGWCWQGKLRLGRDVEQGDWCCCRDMTATVFLAINTTATPQAPTHKLHLCKLSILHKYSQFSFSLFHWFLFLQGFLQISKETVDGGGCQSVPTDYHQLYLLESKFQFSKKKKTPHPKPSLPMSLQHAVSRTGDSVIT